MPYTSYTSYNYPNYGNSRPYLGNKTYTSFGTTSSSYAITPSATTTYVPSYKMGLSNLGTSSYGLTSSTSTISLSNYDKGSLARKKVSAAPTFLLGNTASLRKAFGDSEPTSSGILPNYRGRRFNGDGEKKEAEKSYLPTRRFNKLDNTTNYLAKYGIFDPPKPKEIETSQINVSKPPVNPTADKGVIKRTDPGKIYRNRQAVRLTIKRNPNKNNDPYDVRRNSIKTVAQKLLDKYTTQDKNFINEHVLYGTGDELRSTADPHFINGIYESSCKGEDRSENGNGKITSEEAEAIDSSDDRSASKSSNANNNKRRFSKPGAELEDGVVVLSRATENAAHKTHFANAQEVKDIIVAAALHPDIDIESDEEIKQLIDADSRESNPSSPEILDNANKTSSGRKINPVDSLAKRKDSDPFLLSGGTIIVDKLKRFVKQQVSFKKASVKRAPKTVSDDIDSSNHTVLSVRLQGGKSERNIAAALEVGSQNETRGGNNCVTDSNLINKSNVLLPDRDREQERFLKKSPTSQMALIEGMEKIKMSIAVRDKNEKNKDDSDGNTNGSELSNLSCKSSESVKSSNSGSIHSPSTVVGSLTFDVSGFDVTTCLEDAPWRKKRNMNLNKSKTSLNVLNTLNFCDVNALPTQTPTLSKSSTFAIEKSKNLFECNESALCEDSKNKEAKYNHILQNKCDSQDIKLKNSIIVENKQLLQEIVENQTKIHTEAKSEKGSKSPQLKKQNPIKTTKLSPNNNNTAREAEHRTVTAELGKTKITEPLEKRLNEKDKQSNLVSENRVEQKKAQPISNSFLSLSSPAHNKKFETPRWCKGNSELKGNTLELKAVAKIENNEDEIVRNKDIGKKAGNLNHDIETENCINGECYENEVVKDELGKQIISNNATAEYVSANNISSDVKITVNNEAVQGKVNKLKNVNTNDCTKPADQTPFKDKIELKQKCPTNEILNARNILKRPVKAKPAGIDTKFEINKIPDTNLKKVWRKKDPRVDTPTEPVDELKHARNVFRKPGNTNQITQEKKWLDSKCESDNAKKIITKPKRLWKKAGVPRKNSNENIKLDSDSEDEVNVKQRAQKLSKSPPKSPLLTYSKAKIPCSQNIQNEPKISLKVLTPNLQTSSKTSRESSSRSSCSATTSCAQTDIVSSPSRVTEATQAENLIGLCASKSADSAYGSSPSTPQPNAALQLDPGVVSSACAGSKTTEGDSTSAKLEQEEELCKCAITKTRIAEKSPVSGASSKMDRFIATFKKEKEKKIKTF